MFVSPWSYRSKAEERIHVIGCTLRGATTNHAAAFPLRGLRTGLARFFEHSPSISESMVFYSHSQYMSHFCEMFNTHNDMIRP